MNDTEFKSIENSTGAKNKNWCLLRVKLVRTPDFIKNSSSISLYRRIVYLDSKHKPYAIGAVYMPFNMRNLGLFFSILFSKKTFGHFMLTKFKGAQIKVVSSEDIQTNYAVLLNNETIRYSIRSIYISRINSTFYAEEEFLID